LHLFLAPRSKEFFMSDWTAGYVAEIGYTYGYYTELNPQRLTLALLEAGIAPPQVQTACELGFGQGVSLNVHAAASGVKWHGTDFNPSQAAFAQSLAATSGAQAHLHDQAFEEFAQRDEHPAWLVAVHAAAPPPHRAREAAASCRASAAPSSLPSA
jgi:hypothetical protein